MDVKPRLVVEFEHHKGAIPQRIDHFQLLVPDVQKACEFWMSLGFRLSEYISPDGKDDLLFVFLQRKGNPHDIVFAEAPGPRLHHAAFSIPESYQLLYVCDLAATMGFAANVEFGRAGTAPATRCSSICAIPTATASSCSTRTTSAWTSRTSRCAGICRMSAKRRWMLPARRQWYTEASQFAGVAPREPAHKGDPLTLEKFVAAGMR